MAEELVLSVEEAALLSLVDHMGASLAAEGLAMPWAAGLQRGKQQAEVAHWVFLGVKLEVS